MKAVRNFITDFVFGKKIYPLLVGVLPALYPITHYAIKNFSAVNTKSYLYLFLSVCVLLPVFVSFFIHLVIKNDKLKRFLLLLLNLLIFFFLLLWIALDLRFLYVAIASVLVLIFSYLLKEHINKILIIQLLILFTTSYKIIPHIESQFNYNDSWMQPNDDILKAKFKITPNIYLIQPDGYANFDIIDKEPYNYDNSSFKAFLLNNNFKIYSDFRSNYYSTLSSNSSLFAMKHHYYSTVPNKEFSLAEARKEIVGNNPVIQILKNNNYTNHLVLEHSYLLVNRPEIGFDECNISYDELGFFSKGFEIKNNLLVDVLPVLKTNKKPTFSFIQQNSPSHISTTKNYSKGKSAERDIYISNLKKATIWLEKIISKIEKNDKNALIIIAADHGGFVGMDYTQQIFEIQKNPLLVKSSFSSLCAIKWPKELAEISDDELKSTVNLFRVLFSNLSGDKKYLNQLEDNSSFVYIKEDDYKGVYRCISETGEVKYELLK